MSDLQAAIKFILDPRHETDPSGLLPLMTTDDR